MLDLSKYPRAKRFLQQHPEMSIDPALEWVDKRLNEQNEVERNTNASEGREQAREVRQWSNGSKRGKVAKAGNIGRVGRQGREVAYSYDKIF